MRKSWLPLNSVLPNSNVLILNDHQCNIRFESSTKLPSLYQILSVWNRLEKILPMILPHVYTRC